ncbi:MAG: bifunctional phosphoribosyl-AMP cyclohydrolase/phosphoribosyl-ATP diphosphatase HisIE [Alphaproteobacteria bacterium]|nr:bifunctional phosphoribosyl-AMP cyclohydrolase/phosphoribosyl-ATP diphosphatase HisIE [Alphaproteobacteria bacterium]
MTNRFDSDSIDWNKNNGLVPAIVQDARSLRVLMLGYANQESLQQTLSTGLVTFFSRSKQRLWQKGETSGNVLRLCDIKLDCDKDTLLILAEPQGPTCHLGTESCFGDDKNADLSVLADLAATIHQRRLMPKPDSYTAQLIAGGLTRIAQKVGEEGVETALAAATKSPDLASEAADLLYHLLVLLEASELDFTEVLQVLLGRSQAKSA